MFYILRPTPSLPKREGVKRIYTFYKMKVKTTMRIMHVHSIPHLYHVTIVMDIYS